jgi:hypothetical protein
MKQKMDYQNGRIYKILNTEDDKCYVGSTCQSLAKRFSEHKKRHQNGTGKLYEHMRNIGFDKFYIELITNYPCNTKEELRAKEGEYIREMGSLNILIAGRKKPESQKVWYWRNKDDQCRKRREYHSKNQEKECKRDRSYYENNKQAVLARKKKYKQDNKEQIKRKASFKLACDCGSTYQRRNKAEHMKTKKHQSFIAENKQL